MNEYYSQISIMSYLKNIRAQIKFPENHIRILKSLTKLLRQPANKWNGIKKNTEVKFDMLMFVTDEIVWPFPTFPRPVYCLLLWVSSDCARPITGQVTGVTCPELTLSKRQETGRDVLPRGHTNILSITTKAQLLYNQFQLPSKWCSLPEKACVRRVCLRSV